MVRSLDNSEARKAWGRSTLVKQAGGFNKEKEVQRIDQLKNRIKAERSSGKPLEFSSKTPVSVRRAVEEKRENNKKTNSFFNNLFGGQKLAFSRPGARKTGFGQA